ncbi:MAG: hypothetical protein H2B05_06380 [Nitrosopumilaceae archaeon]|jgi:membrane protein CcdC involved in cytochrome C biogenesis|uniref:Uncharacterized protein n=3 Tax=Candidatus Nitrosomaritimum aestuariumsis TaxID=3342354 RepID=A0AC60W4R3_9ARCH|nr:hypothetical protein [Nitrosopumilaceae archaeon]MBA4454552.1 hypothetical protein [Nitrosopumilaceae archaeon]MBA4462186.1 hypothetical protein [Nitrosopumilaceae archaeon]MBA4463743.1 hypothetical protein [Nitrosopumilaceae archaeon]NCF21645.1 hypothetical protein [Nitrosopumilaceae archaeon]
MSITINQTEEENSLQLVNADSKNVVAVIYLLEIITKVGKHFPVIFLSLASLNVVMAANDFLANSIEFGIMNSLFAIGGFVSIIQMHQRNKTAPDFTSYDREEFETLRNVEREMT